MYIQCGRRKPAIPNLTQTSHFNKSQILIILLIEGFVSASCSFKYFFQNHVEIDTCI
jgi:hypothetical protein